MPVKIVLVVNHFSTLKARFEILVYKNKSIIRKIQLWLGYVNRLLGDTIYDCDQVISLSAYLGTRQCWWKMKSLMQTKMVWSSRPWQWIAILEYKNFSVRRLEVIRLTITCESRRNKPSIFSLVCGSSFDDHGKLSCQENIHHRDDRNICSR